MLAWTMGVNHSVQGTETVTLSTRSPCSPATSAGPGAAPFSITGQCNAMGTREAGFTASMPGYRAYDDPAARAELAGLLGHRRGPPARRAGPGLPRHRQRRHVGHDQGPVDHRHQPGRVVPEPRGARARPAPPRPARRAGRLRDADDRAGRRRAARRHLGREGRHVHQQRAPGVPGAGRGRRRRARPAPTSTSSSPWPSAGAARDELFAGWTAPAGRLRRVAPGVGRAAVRLQRHHLGPHRRGRRRAVAVPRGRPDVPLGGTPRLYADRRFNRPDGRATVRAVEPEPIRDPPRPEYPFLLNTGRTVEHWHTRTKTGRIADPRGPGARGVGRDAPGRRRRARRPRPATGCGSRRPAGDVEPDPGAGHGRSCRPGEVFIPFHWDERCANRLTDDEFDPISREPNYKQCAVQVEALPTRVGR